MNENMKMPNLQTVVESSGPYGGIPAPVPFEEYSKRYEGHINMTRNSEGIVLLQMHTNGHPMIWARGVHRAFHMAIRDIASDPENKLLIITGCGNYWVGYGLDTSSYQEQGLNETTFQSRVEATFEDYIGDAMPLQENLIFDLNIPTIALINGPGYHMDMALQCDLAICTDDTVMFDVHPYMGFASGDGINISYAEQMGSKRAAYYMLTGDPVSAEDALAWGMVNKVVPRDQLMDAGMELAHKIMRVGGTRRGWMRWMTEIIRKPMKVRFANDFAGFFSMEMYSYLADEDVSHNDMSIVDMWNSGGIELPHWEDQVGKLYDINDLY